MQNEMKKNHLRLICSCGTIWPVCEMPVAVDEMVEAINKAECPLCHKSSETAAIYVDKFDG